MNRQFFCRIGFNTFAGTAAQCDQFCQQFDVLSAELADEYIEVTDSDALIALNS